MKRSSPKIRELEIAETITRVVAEEVEKIGKKQERTPADLMALEKLSKVFSTMASSHREDLKNGVWGQMEEAELRQLDKKLNNGNNGSEGHNDSAEPFED